MPTALKWKKKQASCLDPAPKKLVSTVWRKWAADHPPAWGRLGAPGWTIRQGAGVEGMRWHPALSEAGTGATV